jgi:mono/diheme cytochrome c family protein
MKFQVLFIVLTAGLLAACSASSNVQPTPTLNALEIQGQQVYVSNCAGCHALEPDTIVIGPSLAGVATRAETRMDGYDARAYIETSILNPSAYVVDGFKDVMPQNFGKDLTSDDFNAIVAFLLTLK